MADLLSTLSRARPRSGVRLVDEDEQRTIVLQLVPARPRARHRRSRLARRHRPHNRRSPRALGGLGMLMTLLGVLVLIDAGATLVWQEPISALYAKLRQDNLSGALRAEERAAPTPREQRALVKLPDQRSRISYLARVLERHVKEGSAVGRITIPRIGASFVVVRGTSTAALRGGPGIFRETSFPGVPGTTAIAGHRTTYLAPFRHVDQLRAGNRILLKMPYARFTYTVSSSRVVSPHNVRAAVAQVGYSRLVLSACTPLFSAAKRLLVFARLTSAVAAPAALRAGARTPRARAPARARQAATRPAGPPPRLRPS